MTPSIVVSTVAACLWALSAVAADAQELQGFVGGLDAPEEWIVVFPLVAAVSATAWLLHRQRQRMWRRFVRLRGQHVRLMRTTMRLDDASGLLRLFHGGRSQPAELGNRFREVLHRANGMSTRIEHIERMLKRWRLTAATLELRDVSRDLASLGAEVAELQGDLRELSDGNHECARCQTEARALLAEVRQSARASSVGYAQDVFAVLDALERDIAQVERLRSSGDPVAALQRCRQVLAQLHAQQATLAGREATLQWLRGVPAETNRLLSERQRMEAEGFRKLPFIEFETLVTQANQAIEQLARGELVAAAEAQRGLRARLARLRQSLTGVAELRDNNARALKSLRGQLRVAESRLASLPEAGLKERYPAQLWAPAARSQEALHAEAWCVHVRLQEAERDNAMETQRFEEAHTKLREADGLMRALHDALDRCEQAWQSLDRQHARLKERLHQLDRQTQELAYTAARVGLSRDPCLSELVSEAREALNRTPVALDQIAATLDAAQSAYGLAEARLEELCERMARPGIVSFSREEAPRARSRRTTPRP